MRHLIDKITAMGKRRETPTAVRDAALLRLDTLEGELPALRERAAAATRAVAAAGADVALGGGPDESALRKLREDRDTLLRQVSEAEGVVAELHARVGAADAEITAADAERREAAVGAFREWAASEVDVYEKAAIAYRDAFLRTAAIEEIAKRAGVPMAMLLKPGWRDTYIANTLRGVNGLNREYLLRGDLFDSVPFRAEGLEVAIAEISGKLHALGIAL